MKILSPEQQHARMTGEPIPKLILQMSLPTVISMLVTVIYNTADTYFVSQINKSASAAVGVFYSVMAVIQAVGYGLGMGSGSLVSLKLGQKLNKEADKYASSAFLAALVFGTLIGGICLVFLTPFLKLLGCTDTMLPYAVDYGKYILMAAPVFCATFVLNTTLRSEGATTLVMWGLTGGGILNMILDPIFIFGLKMEAGGAALATLISQCASFLILLSNFVFKRSIVKISFKNISKKFKDYFLIISTGAPTICRQGLGSLSSALLNIQAVVYGDAAVAAVTIANKVYVLVRNIVIGIGQGFQPVAGYNFGAGKRQRTKKAFYFACQLGTVVCLVSSIVIAAFARPIMSWFINDAEVINYGVEIIYFCCAVTPVMAFSTYVNQLFQCLGFKWQATFLACCRQGIFFVPAIIILPVFMKYTGVQITQPLADFCTFLISIPFLVVFLKKEFSKDKL